MKSMALYGKEDIRPFSYDLESPHGNDMIVEVLYCGICGSDIRMYFNGPTPRYTIPVVLGHEIAGRVKHIGPKIKEYSVGDIVSIAPIIPCMQCEVCLRGDDHLCQRNQVIGTTIHGGFSELIYMPDEMVSAGGVAKVPQGVPFEALALAETLACCLHGIRLVPYTVGQRFLIIGDGPIGLSFLQLVKRMGASYVVTAGRRPSRRKLSKKMGADLAIDVTTIGLENQLDELFDIVIIANSNPVSVSQAINLTRSGGHILLFSGYTYETKIEVDPNILHYRELQIHGSIDATVKDFNKAVQLLPYLKMDQLISAKFPLDQIKDAFQFAKNNDVIKVVIQP